MGEEEQAPSVLAEMYTKPFAQDPKVEPKKFYKLSLDKDDVKQSILSTLEQRLKTVLVKLDYEPTHDDHKRELRRILRDYARVFGIPVTGQD